MRERRSCVTMNTCGMTEIDDYGPEPFAVNIDMAARQNKNFSAALWTGNHLQLTLMSIPVGGDIGLEIHPNDDQFIHINDGCCLVKMGKEMHKLNYQKEMSVGHAVFIPSGTWHNVLNTGNRPLKLHSIYAPPHHPHGMVYRTKADAEAAENGH